MKHYYYKNKTIMSIIILVLYYHKLNIIITIYLPELIKSIILGETFLPIGTLMIRGCKS